MTDASGRIVFSDLHLTKNFRQQFAGSFSEPIQTILICSPFFDKLPEPFKDIVSFCALMQRRGTDDIQIVTRPPIGFSGSMTPDTAKLLSEMGVQIFVRARPYFHAKMYHIEYESGRFKTFVGSANFTKGGFERNFELVAELQGSGGGTACHREIATMREKGALTFEAWVNKGSPVGDMETE